MLSYLKKKVFFITPQPQHSLPDVFVWMISGGKRVGDLVDDVSPEHPFIDISETLGTLMLVR